MAAGPNTSKDTRLAFETIRIEGLLLQPEWLSKVARRDASSQEDADYRIPKGLNLRDEIGRYWRMAQAQWSDFAAGQAAKGETRVLSTRFVNGLLRDCLGFSTLGAAEPVVIAERTYPIGLSAIAGRVPVVIAPAGIGLDTLEVAFGEQGRKRTAFGLVQELLNAAPGSLWGLVTDGRKLRIVRDNASLTRPAWIEVDLARIFTEDRYADFAAFWLLVHETRFGRLADDGSAPQPAECPLEAWREAGRKEGVRAQDRLRDGVKAALLSLGNGFLAHPDSVALRGALTAGTLTKEAYFQQLLRLVYRLIFLLTAEERELLHPADRALASDAAKQLYARGYSIGRLRERAVRRTAHDRYSDQWQGLRIVFRALANGEPRLGLPALLGLFAPSQTPDLDTATVDNSALLSAMFDLSWLRQAGTLSRVNWRDMGPEELGSVYESLLELVPVVSLTGATVTHFHFATGDETKGNARKTSGSYYTPDSLVQVLLESALEPVIAETIAANPGKEVDALLSLAIVDPACGSGHFLLSAARRLAAHVARIRNGTQRAADERRAVGLEFGIEHDRAEIAAALGVALSEVRVDVVGREQIKARVRDILRDWGPDDSDTDPELLGWMARRGELAGEQAVLSVQVETTGKHLALQDALCTQLKEALVRGGAAVLDSQFPVCPVTQTPIDRVKAEGCPIAALPDEGEARRRRDELRKELAKAKQEFDDMETRHLGQVDRLAKVDAERNSLTERIGDRRSTHEAARQQRKGAWGVSALVDRFVRRQLELETLRAGILGSKAKDELAAESLEAARDRQRATLAIIETWFNQVINQLVGGESEGTLRLDGHGLHANVLADGDRSTVAINALKVAAFDIAVMAASVGGRGSLPGFLMHDSPREADLSVDIYERLFLLVRSLEGEVAGSAPFQYIITTTTPPPKRLQQEPWLVAELSGLDPENRLLRRSL